MHESVQNPLAGMEPVGAQPSSDSQATTQPETLSTMPNPALQAQAQPAGLNYASFGERLIALLIDIVIAMIISGVLYGMFRSSSTTVSTVLIWMYGMVMDVKYGGTLGKRAMKIKVLKVSTGAYLSWMDAFLREVVGKTCSSVVFLLGYFWMLWDDKKQTWHDKIAGSVVVKAE